MAKPKNTQPPAPAGTDDLLQKAAKAIGSALGTLATKTGIVEKRAATPPVTGDPAPARAKRAAPARKQPAARKATTAKKGTAASKKTSARKTVASKKTAGPKKVAGQ